MQDQYHEFAALARRKTPAGGPDYFLMDQVQVYLAADPRTHLKPGAAVLDKIPRRQLSAPSIHAGNDRFL
jgi:hypothetical protein